MSDPTVAPPSEQVNHPVIGDVRRDKRTGTIVLVVRIRVGEGYTIASRDDGEYIPMTLTILEALTDHVGNAFEWAEEESSR